MLFVFYPEKIIEHRLGLCKISTWCFSYYQINYCNYYLFFIGAFSAIISKYLVCTIKSKKSPFRWFNKMG